MIINTHELNRLISKEDPDSTDISKALFSTGYKNRSNIINKVDPYDDIPLVRAIAAKNIDIIKVLFYHGATTKGVNAPCIQWAALREDPEILEYLIKRKGDVNHRHKHNGYTALFGLIDSMEAEKPVTKEQKTPYNNTIKDVYKENAQHIVKSIYNHEDAFNSLGKRIPTQDNTRSVDIFSSNKNEDTKEDINLTLARILLENGADPIIPTEYNNTALKLAEQKNLTDMVKLIKKHIIVPMGITMKDFLKQREKQFLSEEDHSTDKNTTLHIKV